MKCSSLVGLSIVSALTLLACSVQAAEPTRSNSVSPDRPVAGSNAKHDVQGVSDQFLRSSAVSKLSVRNGAGEKIGTVEDLVINTQSGSITYAALGYGGVLGIGEKLFAVPWKQLQLRTDHEEHYFVLNISKDALKAAPGFDKNNWPNFADPAFTNQVDHYYHEVGNPPSKVIAQ